MWRSMAALIVLLPLVISLTGRDVFRMPKVLLFRAETIVLLALGVIRVILHPPENWRAALRDPVVPLIGVAAAWIAVTAAAADNRAVAMAALANVAGLLFFFAMAYVLAARRSWNALSLIFIPAVITSILAIGQALNVWSPIPLDATTVRMKTTALVGNPNDIGMYLVPAIVVCCGFVRFARGRMRVATAAILLILICGIAASQTLTAMIALGAFAAVLALRRRRVAMIAIPALLIVAIITVAIFPSVAVRGFDVLAWLKRGDYDRIVSGRSVAFLAAARMARDHPLLGVGPGGFAWHYFDDAIAVHDTHPNLLSGSMTEGVNFGEVHNDHLQVLAEFGVIGYALFAAAIALFVQRVRNSDDEFVAFIGVPFVVSLLFLMAAQFPLNLVTPAATYAFISAFLMQRSGRA